MMTVRRPVTGWHMTAIFVGFFSIVVAVNVLMATLAVRGFGGTVVDNSYVASQRYNSWLAQGRAQAQIGWQATAVREADGHVRVQVAGAPDQPWNGTVRGLAQPVARRADPVALRFDRQADGSYRSTDALMPGRHELRMELRQADALVRILVDVP